MRLLGRTSDDVLRDLYNGSDVFVMPNLRVNGDMEGFGRVLLEAALCELPVVATGIEGITDAITDGENGTLVAERDPSAFAAAVQAVLTDPAAAHGAGARARAYTLAHFSWDRAGRRVPGRVSEAARLRLQSDGPRSSAVASPLRTGRP